ncbi:MAG: hypothetical protein AB7T06_33270 [Kofleriaceae bacterium]
MHRAVWLLFATLATGCPPPPVEPHQAAAMLRENPQHVGTVSRQELESAVTDPDSSVGTAATPAPNAGGLLVEVVGTVQTKVCFSVTKKLDETGNVNEQHAMFANRMRNAAWSVQARPRTVYSTKTPWPDPAQDIMVKVNTSEEALGRGEARAVVCLPAPVIADDSTLLAFTMSWDQRDRKLALWRLTE